RLEYLENVDLEYKSIQELNESMIQHVKNGVDVYENLNETLQKGTEDEIGEAKDELKSFISDSDREGEDIFNETEELIEKYDLLVVTEYDEDGEEYERFDKGKLSQNSVLFFHPTIHPNHEHIQRFTGIVDPSLCPGPVSTHEKATFTHTMRNMKNRG